MVEENNNAIAPRDDRESGVPPEFDLYRNPDDSREQDLRNAALLVDATRREFLADLDPLTVNSYAVLYARAEKWKRYAVRQHELATKRNDADKERWLRLYERWAVSERWLDRNLIMSGSIRGKRAEQLVDVLAGSREMPSVGGTQVVVPQMYQPPAAPSKRGLWGR